MENKYVRNHFSTFLLLFICMICLISGNTASVSAAGAGDDAKDDSDIGIRMESGSGSEIDLNASGSISVVLCDHQTEAAVPGGEMTLYRVAEVKEIDGSLIWQYTGDFENCGVDMGDISDRRLAESLEKKISPDFVKQVKTIGSDGKVIFEDLPVGLYLLVQTEAAEGYNTVSSFLVSVPLQDGNEWIYDVDAGPKVEAAVPEISGTPETEETPEIPETSGTSEIPESPSSSGGSGHQTGMHSSRLPQTGQLNWPIPVLAVSGMLLFAFGWTLYRGRRENEA
ncbi:MAG: SpaA isopeptide-forming pilin-related protein [Lachnospiraceae bacterium]|nr:SpaA isopeptide-forming pilin-related protein [Lachnospiraceae bacterium]